MVPGTVNPVIKNSCRKKYRGEMGLKKPYIFILYFEGLLLWKWGFMYNRLILKKFFFAKFTVSGTIKKSLLIVPGTVKILRSNLFSF